MTTYDEHDPAIHLRKIEKITAEIENLQARLRREVQLFLEHTSPVDRPRDEGLPPEGVEERVEVLINVPEGADLPEFFAQVTVQADRINQISQKAQSRRALALSRDMDPRLLGYTEEMFNFSFPDVKYDRVLEQFFTWYISKGDTSRNWFEKFLSYAQGAQDRATVGGIETDSMGMPTDPKTRRRWLGKDK